MMRRWLTHREECGVRGENAEAVIAFDRPGGRKTQVL
jgi:hypothetical protein